jgi:hypothetical protein
LDVAVEVSDNKNGVRTYFPTLGMTAFVVLEKSKVQKKIISSNDNQSIKTFIHRKTQNTF